MRRDKLAGLLRGSISSVTPGIRLRLATAEDAEILAKTSRLAGAHMGVERLASPSYQAAARAVLEQGHRHMPAHQAVFQVHNATGEAGGDFIMESAYAAAFDLIAVDRDKAAIGAVRVGPPLNVIHQLLAQGVTTRQAMSLIAATSKIVALAVIPERQGAGAGKALLSAALDLVREMGMLVTFADSPAGLVPFYAEHGLRKVPVASKRLGLNLWPVTGPGTVNRSAEDGPFIQSERGYELVAKIHNFDNETPAKLRELHPELDR